LVLVQEVHVEEIREGGAYATRATSGKHQLIGDLMPQAGGQVRQRPEYEAVHARPYTLPRDCQDLGPSPKEYVMVALASCTAMTIRIYTEGMIKSGKWPQTAQLRKVCMGFV
jgi:hypothetical protein